MIGNNLDTDVEDFIAGIPDLQAAIAEAQQQQAAAEGPQEAA
jgi:hypothetical protein